MIYKNHFHRENVFDTSQPEERKFSTTHRMWHISRVHVVRNWIYLFMKPSLVSGIDLDMNFDPEHWISLWLSRMQSYNQFWCSQLAMMMWMGKLQAVGKQFEKCYRNYLILQSACYVHFGVNTSASAETAWKCNALIINGMSARFSAEITRRNKVMRLHKNTKWRR